MGISMPQYLYHLTDADKVESILKDGIKPGYGYNSDKVKDKNGEVVYLSDEKSIPYWSILLGKDTVLKINTFNLNSDDFKHWDYTTYEEWFTKQDIDPARVSRHSVFIHKSAVMPELAENHIYGISEFIVFMTRMGTYPNDHAEYIDNLNHDVQSSIKVMKDRLDFTLVDKNRVKTELIRIADEGNYTLCDSYCVKERYGTKQLWEQLVEYDFGNPFLKKVEETFRMTYDFIKDTLPWLKDIDTGGYTG